MTGLAFPGNRPIAGWWRQLSPRLPHAIWVGHLLLHRIEALVAHSLPQHLDPLDLHLLKALALAPSPTAAELDTRIHLGRQLLDRALHSLESEGLAGADDAGRWLPTSLGRQALEQGEYPRSVSRREVFHFVESEVRPPHFLRLEQSACVAWNPGEAWHFDPAMLEACIARPRQWKEQHGFPLDVSELLRPAKEQAAWQRVILDQPLRLPAVLINAPRAEEGEHLLGFAVSEEGWKLAARPAFELGPGWQEVFPELLAVPPDDWQQGWRSWCQQRGLVAAGSETIALHPEGLRLRALISARMMERIRSLHSDALRGEAWLLAGTGLLRAAAQLEIAEGEAPRASAGR